MALFCCFLQSLKPSRSLFSEPLKTIASSPLDSNLPSTLVNTPSSSPSKDLIKREIAKIVKRLEEADSGCSDSNEESPELGGGGGAFQDGEGSWSEEPQGEEEEENREPIFLIDVNNDLDLEQIEKD